MLRTYINKKHRYRIKVDTKNGVPIVSKKGFIKIVKQEEDSPFIANSVREDIFEEKFEVMKYD